MSTKAELLIRLSNLEATLADTRLELELATQKRPHRIKLNYQKAQTIRKLHKQHHWGYESLAKRFGVGVSCIKNVVYGCSWRKPR